VKRIDIAGVEDDASPPRPASLGWLDYEVEIVRSRPNTGGGRVFTAMQNLKSQCPIEPDRAWHLVGGQCNRADTLDHRLNSPVSSARRRDPASNAPQFGSRSTHPVSLARHPRTQRWSTSQRPLPD